MGLVVLAVLAGQLSIGWGNDWVDCARDTVAGRPDKPIARGLISRRAVAVAAIAALLACVALSFTLGTVPALVHLVAVGSGWAYDLRLKATVASPAPYAVSFGLLPAVATTAAPGGPWPGTAVIVGAALLGVGAHFANTVADTQADAVTGVRGLPQRIGPSRSLQVSALSLAVAAIALGTATDREGRLSVLALVFLGFGAGLAVTVAVAGPRLGRRAFTVVLLAVSSVIVGFLLSGGGRLG